MNPDDLAATNQARAPLSHHANALSAAIREIGGAAKPG
jgi:hypothetical protein